MRYQEKGLNFLETLTEKELHNLRLVLNNQLSPSFQPARNIEEKIDIRRDLLSIGALLNQPK
ncbi:MAG: hypothetical protein EOP48_26475 [Sphingobacteriales bacterium]|nr:MAG: hypothetical protein EOP48_26475 [Sphingobacteriales bacterium]